MGKSSLLYDVSTGSRNPTDLLFIGCRRKLPGTDHSPPSLAKVKDGWRCTFIPPIHIDGMGRNSVTSFMVTGIVWCFESSSK